MAYDLDRTELNHLMTPNIDPGARAAVIDYLLKNGAFQDNDDDDDHGHGHGHHHDDDDRWGGHDRDDDDRWGHHHHHHEDPTVQVQETYDGVHLDPNAQVLDLTTATNSVTTDSALKVIIENTTANAHLTGHGADDVMIVAGHGNDTIDSSDTSAD